DVVAAAGVRPGLDRLLRPGLGFDRLGPDSLGRLRRYGWGRLRDRRRTLTTPTGRGRLGLLRRRLLLDPRLLLRPDLFVRPMLVGPGLLPAFVEPVAGLLRPLTRPAVAGRTRHAGAHRAALLLTRRFGAAGALRGLHHLFHQRAEHPGLPAEPAGTLTGAAGLLPQLVELPQGTGDLADALLAGIVGIRVRRLRHP